jgi:hypothetical protein
MKNLTSGFLLLSLGVALASACGGNSTAFTAGAGGSSGNGGRGGAAGKGGTAGATAGGTGGSSGAGTTGGSAGKGGMASTAPTPIRTRISASPSAPSSRAASAAR